MQNRSYSSNQSGSTRTTKDTAVPKTTHYDHFLSSVTSTVRRDMPNRGYSLLARNTVMDGGRTTLYDKYADFRRGSESLYTYHTGEISHDSSSEGRLDLDKETLEFAMDFEATLKEMGLTVERDGLLLKLSHAR